MSKSHPIIAITGSSGAGTSNIKTAFEQIFRRLNINAAFIAGDSFHRYDRKQMDIEVEKALKEGKQITHFGPEGNQFDQLVELFKEYSESGTGKCRHYVHNEFEADQYNTLPGALTAWETIAEDTDLLFYEGLHGGLITGTINIAQYVDILVGVVPIINLEWMQKIHRDKEVRGYTSEGATEMILNRMHDYVHYITPQFSRTDVNFQRVPTVDTSNPFATDKIPANDESFTVIHVRNLEKLDVDFRYLLEMLEGSFMSNPETIVVPSGKMIFAMQLILNPVITRLIRNR